MANPFSPRAPQPLAPIAVDVVVGETRLRLQAQLPAGPTRPVRLLPLLRHVDEALIKDAQGRLQAGGAAVSCQAGCAACCHYLVPISRIEARRLLEVIANLPPKVREVVEARFAAARERLLAAGLLPRLLHPETITPDEHDALGEAYFALDLPCPFLEDQRCAIYKERPLTCREFLVVSDPSRCSAPGAAPIQMVRLPGRGSVAAAALDPDQGPPFFEGGWVPLILAPEWAREHPEPPPTEDGPALARRFFDALVQSGQ
jgi:Fe-S-cluster containining protein